MANHLRNEEEIAAYLRQVLQDNDPAELAGALHRMMPPTRELFRTWLLPSAPRALDHDIQNPRNPQH